jgi:spore germination protein KB
LNDKTLTHIQALAMVVMFNFGSSVVMGVSTGVAQDSWIALILGAVFSIPAACLCGRIATLNRGQCMFDAAVERMGKVLGKLFTALMVWYALHLSALVLRNFSEFIKISSLVETPQLPVGAIMVLTVAMLVRGGGKALGKWSVATLPIVLGIVVLTVILSVNVMHPDHFLPVFDHPFSEIAKDAFQTFSFPFAEAVLFMTMMDIVAPGDSVYKIALEGLALSALVFLIVVARNMMVLGTEMVAIEYFPSYSAARIINLGDFLSRIEGSISVNFMLAGVSKLAVCLIAASRGVARLFDISNWRRLVIPMALMTLMVSAIIYRNTMEMFAFVKYYPYYAIPFQIILPLALWVFSEISARREKRLSGATR